MRKYIAALCAVSALLISTAHIAPVYAEEETITLGKDGLIRADKDQSSIKTQPQDVQVNYPEGAQFHVEPEDPDDVSSYQWYATDGYSIFALEDASARTDTLIIPSTSQDNPLTGCACVIRTKDGKETVSQSGSLEVVNRDENKTVLYAGSYAIEPGEKLDLSEAGIGSGTITFGADGTDMTFENIVLHAEVQAYDTALLWLHRREAGVTVFTMRFLGECSVENTSSGSALSASFASEGRSTHPVIAVEGDGQLSLSGGSDVIYTDGNIEIGADMKISSYGDSFCNGIRANDLTVKQDASLDIVCHGTAIQTEGDLTLAEGAKVNADSTPVPVLEGENPIGILRVGGSLNTELAELNITGTAKAEYFAGKNKYPDRLDGIAMSGEGSMTFSHSTVSIDLSAEESDTGFTGGFCGISAAGPLTLTGASSAEIKVNAPGAMNAAGIDSSADITAEGVSGIRCEVTGAGEVYGLHTDGRFTLADASADLSAVSSGDGGTYGVMCGDADIRLSAQSYTFHSCAKGGAAFAADTGETGGEGETYDDNGYEAAKILLGSRSSILTPDKGKVRLFSIPVNGAYIRAEAIADSKAEAPAEEVSISVKSPSFIPYFIAAVIVGLVAGFAMGQKKNTEKKKKTQPAFKKTPYEGDDAGSYMSKKSARRR